ncbi:MAG TPA: PQQ-binding-like beta-propeller repeat protein [Acidimicrobiales bacterium]|nr:PQQ-binding-like beta-propeller repeat protein [Acidimicrobiales bacterium]
MAAHRRTTWQWAMTAALLLILGGDAAAKATPRAPGTRTPAKPRCALTAQLSDGGDWPSLNHDPGNTRNQRAEDRIGTREVADLEPAWSFDGASVGITGGTRSTPVVAYGCVYVAFGMGYLGDRGDVVALDADTGALVWHRQIDGSILGLAAANGMIYATPSRGTRGDLSMPVVTKDYAPAGSYATAFDAHSGKTRWTSARLDDGNAKNGTFVNASPVAFRVGGRELVFVPLAGGGGDGARVPMYFIDALTGSIVRRAFTLTDAEYDAGFGGTGVWSTAAYDATTQHLYVGTADSDAHTRQHPYNNALLRVDANPTRTTFATVVDSYSGTSEHADLDAVIGSEQNPACGLAGDAVGIDPPTFFDTSASPTCLELDLDFGASPNLYDDASGRLRVGALQKSGIYHSVDAATMNAAWTFLVGPGGAFMDGATAAIDGDRVLVAATPNLLYGLGGDAGDLRWAATTDADLFSYQPVTVANGVVYAINDLGLLVGVDAATGFPLLRRSIALDGGFDQCLGVGAGVAVARHTVFAPCDAGGLHDLAGLPSPAGGLVALRLPR